MVKTFCTNPLSENTYLYYDETGEGVIIDCGAYNVAEENEIARYVQENNITLKYALLTHGHFDHCYGLHFIHQKYGLKPLLHCADEKFYTNAELISAQLCGLPMNNPLPPIGEYISEETVITFGHTSLTVIHTPGHTPGGVCYYNAQEGILFSGDTLFQGSVGRTDMPGGSMQQEINSIVSKLMVLPVETRVYTGHGPSTTIGYEQTNNMYF